MDRPTIYLLSNSPGEVTTFVRPVVQALAARHPDWTLQVCLVPCPYATGAESSVIRDWPETPDVWTPWQTTRAWLTGAGRGRKGVVVFLGGDPWHALLLKKRFAMPAVAYFPEPSSWERTRWLGGFDLVAVGYSKGAGNQAPPRVAVPDLRVDAVLDKLQKTSGVVSSQTPTLALFPGSRWLHLKAVLGPFLRATELVSDRIPNLRVMLAASPFVSRQRLADAAAGPLSLGLDFTTSSLRDDTLLTRRGLEVEVVWGDPYRVMLQCDLAISLPGTNTAELAIAGKPTVIPISSRVPVGGGGLLGLLDRLPGFTNVKKRLKLRKHRRLSLLALPNQLAGQMIMPELFVEDDLTNLADLVASLLSQPQERARIGREAKAVMGEPGGARCLVRWLETILERGVDSQKSSHRVYNQAT